MSCIPYARGPSPRGPLAQILVCCRAHIPPPSACSIGPKSRRTAEGPWTDLLQAMGRMHLTGPFTGAPARLVEPPPGMPSLLWTEVPEDEPRQQPKDAPRGALGRRHCRVFGHLRHLRALSAAHSQVRWRHLPGPIDRLPLQPGLECSGTAADKAQLFAKRVRGPLRAARGRESR